MNTPKKTNNVNSIVKFNLKKLPDFKNMIPTWINKKKAGESEAYIKSTNRTEQSDYKSNKSLPQDISSSSKPLNNIPQNINEQIAKEGRRYNGSLLKYIVFLAIADQYFTYVFFVEMMNINEKNIYNSIIRMLIFHLIFFLLISSLYATITTNPGRIPLYWVINIY